MSKSKSVEVESVEQASSKSQQMIQLFEAGLKIAEIARQLGVRYQVVYNTLSVKGVDVRSRTSSSRDDSKAAKVRELLLAGASKRSIARQLGVEWSYVHRVAKKLQAGL